MKRKLYKSRIDKKICGVCGGIAEYLEMDSTIVRLICLLSFCVFGVGVFIYFCAALIMPYDNSKI